MAELHADPVVELVRQAMGTAMLVVLEDPSEFVAKLRASDQSAPVHLFWTEEAEKFVRIRSDLVVELMDPS
jgi:small nuclear ribonucleoprotein (snRNP)-like protein